MQLESSYLLPEREREKEDDNKHLLSDLLHDKT